MLEVWESARFSELRIENLRIGSAMSKNGGKASMQSDYEYENQLS